MSVFKLLIQIDNPNVGNFIVKHGLDQIKNPNLTIGILLLQNLI